MTAEQQFDPKVLDPHQNYRVRFKALPHGDVIEGVGEFEGYTLTGQSKFIWDIGHPNGTSFVPQNDIVEVWETDQVIHFPRPLPVEKKIFSVEDS